MNLGVLGSLIVEVEAKGATAAKKDMHGMQQATRQAGNTAKQQVPLLEKMGKRWSSVLTLVAASGAAAFGLIAKSSPSVLASLRGIQFAFENIFMIIGEELSPIFETFESVMWKIVDVFDALSPTTKTFIAGIVGAIAVIGAIAAAVLGASYVVPILSAAFTALAAFVGVSVGTILAALAVVVIAVAALYTAWKNNLFGIRDKVYSITSWISAKWKAFMSIITDKNTTTWQKVVNVLMFAFSSMKEIGTAIQTFWKNVGIYLYNTIKNAFSSIADVIKSMMSKAYDYVADYVGKIISAISNAISKIKSLYSSSSSSSSSSGGVDVPAGKTYSISTGSFRAMGGGVVSGASYLVGENGPEIFTPSSSGRIASNNDSRTVVAGSSGTTELNQKIELKLDGKTVWNSVKRYAAADLRRGGA
jgi:phage-related protein